MAPKLRRPGDPPARYGANEESFTVEINHGGFFCGFGASKTYVDGKVAKFDECEADTWSPLWLTDFMGQLGYNSVADYTLYWLLPGKNLDTGLRIVDCDTDTLSMIAVVPKFQYFQLFVDHKDMLFGNNEMDDIHITGTPDLPPVMSPKSVGGHEARRSNAAAGSSSAGGFAAHMAHNTGHEPRRSQRKLSVEETHNDSDDSDDSEADADWVDSDNEIAKDDDDLYDEWVDEDSVKKKREKSNWELGSDYDTDDDFEEKLDSDYEEADPAPHVEVVDAEGKKKLKKKVKLKRWRPENMTDVEFHIGMVFLSVGELRDAIQQYIIKERRLVTYKKNDMQRIRACCRVGCTWYLFAAPDSRTSAWVVKKYVGQHTCSKFWKLKQLTAKYLATKYLESFRADDKMSLKNFGRLVQQDYNMNPSKSKLSRARRIAMKKINGDELEQYNLLWDFAAEIRRSNPGSTMFVNAKLGLFENCYMSLDACKRGFLLGCRPVICIDGCHIKNKFGGVMLTAVGVDPNDCIFPISIGIVEVEDTKSWKWFLGTLKEDLGIENTGPWTLMSDRQKGLINAVNELFPYAQHRFCVRHLHQNFAKNWKGDIFKNKLWQIARATRLVDWQKYMDEMKALDQDAYAYLDAIDPRQWCKAYFDELPKCDLLLNNSCEVFNKYILDAREMPIVTSLKKIKDQLMTRFYNKSKEPEEWCGSICPKIRKKLDKNIEFSNNYDALPAAEFTFKVMGLFGEYEVNIDKKECSCRSWQLSGIPCRHGVACLRHENIKPEDVLNKCYSIEAFKLAYSHPIKPCGDPRVWPKMNGPPMRPPKFDKQVGRPSKKRRKSPLEEEDGTRMSRHGIISHCGVCNEPGHNRRKCPQLGRDVPNAAAEGPELEPEPVPNAPAEGPELEPEPIHVVFPQDEPELQQEPNPPKKKLPVKRKTSAKKQTIPQMSTNASSVVTSTTSDLTQSSVIQLLQEQAVATQQSQTPLPGPLPESQFVAACRHDLPPPPPKSTATLGLKRRKIAHKTKENKNPLI